MWLLSKRSEKKERKRTTTLGKKEEEARSWAAAQVAPRVCGTPSGPTRVLPNFVPNTKPLPSRRPLHNLEAVAVAVEELSVWAARYRRSTRHLVAARDSSASETARVTIPKSPRLRYSRARPLPGPSLPAMATSRPPT
jgi:hypothetical protein